jgi:prevent-host-death family protein
MTAISATEARSNFSEYLGRVAYGKERVTIERRGRPLAVLLPLEDVARLEAGDGDPAGAAKILSAVAENIPGTVYQRIRQPDGREENSYVSPGIRDVFGIEPDAAISDPQAINRAIHPEDRALRARAIAESARALSTYDVQYRVLTPAGETKWLHTIARPERRADGAVIWSGLTLDITKWKATEAALRETEARLAAILDHAPVEIYLKDTEGRFIEVNRHYENLWGMTGEQVQGKLPAEVYDDAAFAEASRAHDLAVLETGQTLEREDDIELGDGRHSLHMIKFPIRDDAGRVTGLGAIASDVTERKRAEEALRRSKDEFDLVANNIPVLISFVDRDRRFRFANKGYEDWYGIPQERIAGRHIREIFGEERYKAVEARIESVLKGESVRYEEPVTYNDGMVRHISVELIPHTDENGAITGFVSLTQDTSERKWAESALRESEALLHQAAEMANLGYWVWDETENRCIYCSETLAQMNDVTVEEYLTRFATMESLSETIHPEDRERYDRIIFNAAEERRPYDIEFRDANASGEFRYLRELGEPILDANGKLVRTVGILQDVTHYRLAETALQEARDELEQRVEERTRELHATNRALEEEAATRKAVEARLRESERDLLNLIEGSVLGVLIITEDRRPRFANQAYAQIFGYQSPEEILALETTLPLIAPYEIARLDELRKPHFGQADQPIGYEFDGIRKDGATIRLQCMARAMTWRGERVAQITLHDITERKKAEEELARSEERLRQATELAGLGHCIWDSIEDR